MKGQWIDQEDEHGRGHWYNLSPRWIDPTDGYDTLSLPKLWVDAIANPGVMQEVTWTQGVGLGSEHIEYAMYDKERGQMLAGEYSCPMMFSHTMLETCKCCGQHG